MKVPAAGKKKVFGANVDIFCVVENFEFRPNWLYGTVINPFYQKKKKSRAGKQTEDLPVEGEA